ncbi:MAG: aldo/keto reductase, partial [Anaerovoracaceae bacterium]
MINKNGLPLLGFGCLRLQKNIEESEKQILYALEQGITYFDTAYIYPGNEVLLGKIFAANHCRDQVQIATKLPHYLVKKPQDLERYFQIQLSRLQTNYVDYYLFHMLPDKEVWNKLISLGVLDWIKEKKASGQIKKIGFSYHGNTKNFLDLLDAYPWEFCQVQYNYMDEFAQAGRQGVETAWKKGIPVIIMEPLRGGLLANHLPEKAISIMKAKDPTKSPAYWAFRWLFTQPSISCVLSGMNTMEMLTENLQIVNE